MRTTFSAKQHRKRIRRQRFFEQLEPRLMLAVVNWSGDIPDGTVWSSSDVHRITGDVRVPEGATLTVEPGTLVQADVGIRVDIIVEGKLLANGTAAQPIVFSSTRDDSGLDGVLGTADDVETVVSSSAPARGNWSGLQLQASSSGNVLSHVELRYAGDRVAASLITAGASTLTNVKIIESSAAGVRIDASNPTIDGITLRNNAGSAISMDLASRPVINSVSMQNNGKSGLVLDAGTLVGDTNWDATHIPYVLTNDVTVPTGATLNIAPGSLIQSDIGLRIDLIVQGSLVANGTSEQPIVFTSTRDDSGLDGLLGTADDVETIVTASNPASSNWSGVRMETGGTGSSLSHVQVRYAGDSVDAALISNGSGPLNDVTILASGRAGLRINNGSPVINGLTLRNNGGTAISMDLASNPTIRNVTLTNNGVNGLTLDTGTLVGDTFWNNPELPYFLTNDVTVPTGKTLTVGAGQIIAAPVGAGAEIIVDGTLHADGTPSAPIYFTSVRDNPNGIDLDKGNSSPSIGNWDGIRFRPGSVNNVLSRARVLYAGKGGPAIRVENASLELSSVQVSHSFDSGLIAIGDSDVLVVNSLLSNHFLAAARAESGASLTILNSTLASNAAGVESDGGGTVVTLTNNLITHNSKTGVSSTRRGRIEASFNDVFNPATNAVNYAGLINLTGTAGNISVDPMYVDRGKFDFHLQAQSPVIDAGTSVGTPQDDFDFNWRVDQAETANIGGGDAPFYDLGAFEFGGRERMVSHRPVRDVAQIVRQAVFTFRDIMDTSSFSIADDIAAFTGPRGAAQVRDFQWLNDSQLAINFAAQAAAGLYEVLLDPTVSNSDNLPLDTDSDGTRGEATDDQYLATWTIVPPRITRHVPSNFVSPPLDKVTLHFDREMDTRSFAITEDIVHFRGPDGDLAVTGFQ